VRKHKVAKRVLPITKRMAAYRSRVEATAAEAIKRVAADVRAEARADVDEQIALARADAFEAGVIKGLADGRTEAREVIAKREGDAARKAFHDGERAVFLEAMAVAKVQGVTHEEVKGAVERVALHALTRARGSYALDAPMRKAAVLEGLTLAVEDALVAVRDRIITRDEMDRAIVPTDPKKRHRVIERNSRGRIVKFETQLLDDEETS
jgi:hypothetical protein